MVEVAKARLIKRFRNVLEEEYMNAEILSQVGGFSIVLKAMNRVLEREEAIKAIDCDKLLADGMTMEKIEKEVTLIAKLNHKNVVKVHHRIRRTKEDYDYIFIIMELCTSTLADTVREHPEGVPVPQARKLLKQIVEGVNYLHGKKIIHRDLKLDNIFELEGVLKIGDFNISKEEGKGVTTTASQMFLSLKYAPPERLVDQNPGDSRADIWSIGVIYYLLLHGVHPFVGTNQQVLENIAKINYLPVTKGEHFDLQVIQMCLVQEKDRFYIGQLREFIKTKGLVPIRDQEETKSAADSPKGVMGQEISSTLKASPKSHLLEEMKEQEETKRITDSPMGAKEQVIYSPTIKSSPKSDLLQQSDLMRKFKEYIAYFKYMKNQNVKKTFKKAGEFNYSKSEIQNIEELELRKTFSYDDGCNYTGFWNPNTNTREGMGVSFDLRGGRYDGYWNNDKPNGQGRKIFANGDMNEGDFLNGQLQGKGAYIWATGDMYTGDYIDGQRHGQGILESADGTMYEGAWVKDKEYGKGRKIYVGGHMYEGDFLNGQFQGKGVYNWSDGDRYTGDFNDGVRHGQGLFKWADGTIYEGAWVRDKEHGKGRKIYVDGHINEGDFLNGQLQGKGVRDYPCGDRYTGDFNDGQRHGQGLYEWADGTMYEGAWVKDKQHGKGRFYKNGKWHKCTWKNGHNEECLIF